MTAANMITIIRLLLVPAVIYWLLSGEWRAAFAGFAIAGVSDAVDGFIARRFKQHTRLGAYLDPAADKLLLVSVFIVLGLLGALPPWLVIAAVGRDAMIAGAVVVASLTGKQLEPKPLMVSKANTLIQVVLAAIVLAELAFATDFGWVRPGLIVLSGLLTVASAGAYLLAWSRYMSNNGDGEPHSGR